MATKRTPSKEKMEFEAMKASKPGASKRAQKFDDKSDKAIARKFGVKYKG